MAFLTGNNYELGPGKKQRNLKQQSRHQYDFLNPNELKNLRLSRDRQWEEAVDPNYVDVENKETVKELQADMKVAKKIVAELDEPKEPFKMARFKDVEPAIKAKDLETTLADRHRAEENTETAKRAADSKYYIRRNMRDVDFIGQKRKALEQAKVYHNRI